MNNTTKTIKIKTVDSEGNIFCSLREVLSHYSIQNMRNGDALEIEQSNRTVRFVFNVEKNEMIETGSVPNFFSDEDDPWGDLEEA